MADTRDIDLLADLLDGTLDAAEAPAELAKLAGLADAVRSSVTLVPPSPAFREALREQVLSDVASSVASGAAGAAGTAATAITPLQAIAAAVAAATVLAGSGIAALAPGAVPGDALYGAKRGIESAQLAVGGVERDVRLLLDLTTERVEEALGLVDTAVVLDLLAESEAHLQDALALLDELDPATAAALLADAVAARSAALDTLVATTTDLTVGVRADQLRDATRALLPATPAQPAGDGGPSQDGTVTGDEGDDGQPIGSDSSPAPGDATDDVVDDVTDTVDDVVDDVTDTVDDVVDDVTDTVDDVVDELPDVSDDPTDVGGDLLGP